MTGAETYRKIALVGLADIALGFVLAALGATGVFGDGMQVMTWAGLAMAAVGAAVFIYFRNKAASADDGSAGR